MHFAQAKFPITLKYLAFLSYFTLMNLQLKILLIQ